MTTSASPRYDDLSALFFNCTLKPSPQLSNTQGLIDLSAAIMRKHGARVETIRAADHDIATGVWPDMTEHGWASDAWPAIYQKVLAAWPRRTKISVQAPSLRSHKMRPAPNGSARIRR